VAEVNREVNGAEGDIRGEREGSPRTKGEGDTEAKRGPGNCQEICRRVAQGGSERRSEGVIMLERSNTKTVGSLFRKKGRVRKKAVRGSCIKRESPIKPSGKRGRTKGAGRDRPLKTSSLLQDKGVRSRSNLQNYKKTPEARGVEVEKRS